MYKIIGGDGRQYGPITTEQMRQWLAEGRANGSTLVQAEGATDWTALSAVPELAAILATSVAPPRLAADDPRKSKLIAGLLGILVGWCGVHRFYLGYTGIGVAQIFVTLCTGGLGALWGFIEGILILVGTGITTDADGRTLKDQ